MVLGKRGCTGAANRGNRIFVSAWPPQLKRGVGRGIRCGWPMEGLYMFSGRVGSSSSKVAVLGQLRSVARTRAERARDSETHANRHSQREERRIQRDAERRRECGTRNTP